uniref:Uncharacterized protein n=1 Tax=Eutreptiella gymnastica TaxID=73025 RepID=A0A7S1JF51_9EUGL
MESFSVNCKMDLNCRPTLSWALVLFTSLIHTESTSRFLSVSLKRTETITPQISSLASNCSPTKAMRSSSHKREAAPFFKRTENLPPSLFASCSHSGGMPFTNR